MGKRKSYGSCSSWEKWSRIADEVSFRLFLCLAVLFVILFIAQAALKIEPVRSWLLLTERLEGIPYTGDVFCISVFSVV
ncbi:hypothetical protein DNH61_23070 [Paenibacillus sambharensis]|uniref:Uncharacterized protein n=1 Tax=Paenibacillus sambharensis TaxID=1803190 RepID=A0A2W1LEN9_9BACL|nr:hypothetical protein [Paenibacillus sambharensis]PZD93505.1 hypothetical protein DNH61_23070 [Paenibacillus sambharensis]